MNTLHTTLLAVPLALATTLVAAEPRLKAGLWEHAITVRSESGQVEKAMADAQAQIAKLPPERRREIEQMMAARGISVGASGSTTTTVRVCLTAAKAERGNVPVQVGDCRQNVVAQDNEVSKLTFACLTTPPSTGTGELRVLSPTSTLATARIDTTVNGKSDRIETTQRGAWLADDCGSVEPEAD